MKKYVKLVFLLVGFLLLGWAVSAVDLNTVKDLLIGLGFGFIVILLIYGSVTWFDTIAWQKTFKRERSYTSSVCGDLWRIR